MPVSPDPIEEVKGCHDGDARPELPRLIREALKQEHKRTEKLLEGLLLAVNAETRFLEERVLDKLDQIDTSLDLIAQELARRCDDRRPDAPN